MFAQMIDSPKKYAFSKNKLTNLAIYTKHLKEIGQEIILSDYGRTLVEAEKAKPVFEIKKVGRQADVDVDLREEALSYKIYGTLNLWWLLCLVNNIQDATKNPELGSKVKAIKPQYVNTIISQINTQLRQ